MELRCPKCNSTNLKKVSLAYEEGASRTQAETRMRAAVVGGSGADLVVGRASTSASHESALSKKLRPPAKWSYRKLVFWSALLFVCGGWFVFYINTITRNAPTIISPTLAEYALVAGLVLAVILAVVLGYNLSVYPKHFAEWDRSYVCQHCGMVSEQQL